VPHRENDRKYFGCGSGRKLLANGKSTTGVRAKECLMKRLVLTVVATATLIGAIAIPLAYADSITINSSNAVTFLSNGTSTSTDFPSPFTAADFNLAQAGASAVVLASTPFYTTAPSLTADGAQWIGTSAGAGNGSSPAYTALYAISFDIPDAFVSGSLTLNYEVDNALGDNIAGIYLNGTALPGSTGIPCGVGVACTGSFTALQTYTDGSVTADLVQGTNWLYIDGVNLGAEGGLIFSANTSTVNSTTSPVPEPASMMLFGTGLVALVGGFRRSRAR
jgi:hypothetical protein